MARPLRLELPGAVYHVTSRGHARQDTVAELLVVMERRVLREGLVHARARLRRSFLDV